MAAQNLQKSIDEVKGIAYNMGDRTIVFFDAVMAIAITLLALEIGIPVAETFAAGQLEELYIPFTALFVSFIVLGQAWYIHMKSFSNERLVRSCPVGAHLVLMFFIVLFPKTTELIAEYPSSPYALAIYLIFYTAIVLIEGYIITTAYSSQIRTVAQTYARHYHEAPKRENIIKAIGELAKRNHLCNDLFVALKGLSKIDGTSLFVGLVATFASVFSLFLNPFLCYIFFAAEMVVNIVLSRHAKRYRDALYEALRGLDDELREDDGAALEAEQAAEAALHGDTAAADADMESEQAGV